ncbi:hypothetical protein EVG20_g8450 [Dentipellis fragilis]|uniref:Uncharacterized protein n=1 Tax=Dentipellis fragilis TaxID=205917 RepID=A0A4Y9Y5A6_9AGAM|nr:hypothetical protein EVG20_g8450 [Dentipellis fragilis]
MPPTSKRRRSGLSGVELASAVVAVKALVNKTRQDRALNTEEVTEEDETDLQQLQGILQMLQSKIDPPQSYSFSGFTVDHLRKMGISFSDVLTSKTDVASQLAKADSLGADGLWSADMLYRHLQFLEGLNEAAARLWINAFFYRVASMTPNGSKVVLSVEQGIPSVTLSDQSLQTVSGYIYWTAIATSPEQARRFLYQPQLQELKSEDSALFVSEAKGPDQLLQHHISQAIYEMSRKTMIRGVLTNGRGWVFLILKLNSGGGGTYFASREIFVHAHGEIEREAVSKISAIIADWVCLTECCPNPEA